jgi:flagellar basal body-associated protein FliL
MKKKDMIYLIMAVVILLVAGYLGYVALAPKGSTKTAGVEVEKVGVIPAKMDTKGLAALNDEDKSVNYNLPVDLSGLKNQAPFGP